MRADILGLVPIRGFRSGKSRLAATLSADDRVSISQWMLGGVIRSALDVDRLDGLAVISPDATALAYARALDQRVIPILQRDDDPGLNAAVTTGRDWAVERGAAGLLVIFGDLPLLTPTDVRTVLEQPSQVVVACDRHGTGTNVSLVRFEGRGVEFEYQYGAGSAQLHEAEAARLGLSFAKVTTPGAAFDLDTPDDWKTFTAENSRGSRHGTLHVGPVAGATAEPIAIGEQAS